HFVAFVAEALAGGKDESHWAGQALDDRATGDRDLGDLDVDVRVPVGAHPGGQAEAGGEWGDQSRSAEQLADSGAGRFAGQADRERVHADHTEYAVRVSVGPVPG